MKATNKNTFLIIWGRRTEAFRRFAGCRLHCHVLSSCCNFFSPPPPPPLARANSPSSANFPFPANFPREELQNYLMLINIFLFHWDWFLPQNNCFLAKTWQKCDKNLGHPILLYFIVQKFLVEPTFSFFRYLVFINKFSISVLSEQVEPVLQ